MVQEQREVLAAELRPLARFSTAEEHEELIDDLLTTKKLRCTKNMHYFIVSAHRLPNITLLTLMATL